MKKFFVMAALVGVALTSCMKNEVYVPTCDAPISFEVANYEAQTRAEGGAFDTRETFGVKAWSAYTDTNGTTTYPLITGEEVYNDGTNWTTRTPYYWPLNGTVDFIAYYPADVVPNITYDYDGGDTYTYTNYEVDDVDLMYADKAIRYSENIRTYGFTGVPTLFRHALAKVNFKVKNAYTAETENPAITYAIIVNSITLNVYNKGTVTLKNAVTANDATATHGTWSEEDGDDVWTPTDVNAFEELSWADNTLVLTDGTAKDYATRTQYVLPQTLVAGKQDITVDYDVIQYHVVTDATTGTKTTTQIGRNNYSVTKDLRNLTLTSWEMNKNITYTISISAQSNQIFFDPYVDDWSTEDATGGVTIP